MKVENIKSSKGNLIPNQFVLFDDDNEQKICFQSYTSLIATLIIHPSYRALKLEADMWDYSNTTRKYFKEFINNYTPYTYETKAQWEKEIKANDNIEVL